MAILAQSHNHILGNGFASRFQAVRARVESYRSELRQRRRIARELQTYSDAELAELGFSRFDIPAVAAGTYRR